MGGTTHSDSGIPQIALAFLILSIITFVTSTGIIATIYLF